MYGSQKIGFIKNFIPIFVKLVKMLIGIFNGIFPKLVNLLNIIRVNTMIGTVTVGEGAIINPMILRVMAK